MTHAIFQLGYDYQKQKDYNNMKKCYINAIEKGHSYAMYNLGKYYEEQKDYENMKKYYLMAIKKGSDLGKEFLTNLIEKGYSSDGNVIERLQKSIEKDKERLKSKIELLDKFEEEKKKVYDKIYNLVVNDLENNENFYLYQYITEKILKELCLYEKDLYTASTVILKNNLINYKNEFEKQTRIKNFVEEERIKIKNEKINKLIQITNNYINEKEAIAIIINIVNNIDFRFTINIDNYILKECDGHYAAKEKQKNDLLEKYFQYPRIRQKIFNESERNTLLALQILNKYANDKKIRVEDAKVIFIEYINQI
jgi:hypothetical protein